MLVDLRQVVKYIAQLVSARAQDAVDHYDAVLRVRKAEEERFAEKFAASSRLALEALEAEGHEGAKVEEGLALIPLSTRDQLGFELLDRLVSGETHGKEIWRDGFHHDTLFDALKKIAVDWPSKSVRIAKFEQLAANLGALQCIFSQSEEK